MVFTDGPFICGWLITWGDPGVGVGEYLMDIADMKLLCDLLYELRLEVGENPQLFDESTINQAQELESLVSAALLKKARFGESNA